MGRKHLKCFFLMVLIKKPVEKAAIRYGLFHCKLLSHKLPNYQSRSYNVNAAKSGAWSAPNTIALSENFCNFFAAFSKLLCFGS